MEKEMIAGRRAIRCCRGARHEGGNPKGVVAEGRIRVHNATAREVHSGRNAAAVQLQRPRARPRQHEQESAESKDNFGSGG